MNTLLSAWLAALAAFALDLLLGLILRRGGSGFREWHHAYLSVPIGLAGALLHSPPIMVLAFAIAYDDAEEHLVQVALNEPAYVSPLHRLWYGTIGSWGPLLKLGVLLDQLLGRKAGS